MLQDELRPSASAPCLQCGGLLHPRVQHAHLLHFSPSHSFTGFLATAFLFLRLDFPNLDLFFSLSSSILASPRSYLHSFAQSHRLHEDILGSHLPFAGRGWALRRRKPELRALCLDQCSPKLKCK